MKDIYNKLCKILGEEQVKVNEEMKKHTTFRVGGPAAYYIEPEDEQSLAALLNLCSQEAVPYFVLGNGSNMLVSDQGYEGVIISMGKLWGQCNIEDTVMTAGAGCLLSAMARQALEQSLTGLEFAAGIPGSFGGAVVMNAGAYGSEIKEVLTEARVMTDKGEILTIPASELELGYRTSCIPKNHYIVLGGTLQLQRGEKSEIQSMMEDLAGRRKEKQPLEYPSAGSTFKRPEGHFAGKLIQDAGLRGYRVGGAQVSEKHCGFVINREQATAADIWNLCQDVKKKVENEFGVTMELEVKTLGNF